MSLEELIAEACEGTALAERQTILETGSLEADGVAFTLLPGGVGDESSLYVYCDFGTLPSDDTVAVLKRLLEINLFLYGNTTPSFVLNPNTEHVLLACRMNSIELTGQRFKQALREMASFARQWQANRFLPGDEIDPDRSAAVLPRSSASQVGMFR
jgi:hypothetical protein